jgi:hypothetical protein
MVAVTVTDVDRDMEPGYGVPSCDATGTVCSTLFHPSGYSLWELEAELDTGAELVWRPDHGDEVLFVLTGELEVDGAGCGPRTAVIVERGVAAAAARAVAPSRVLHFGPASTAAVTDGLLGPARATGHGVRVVAPAEAEPVGPADGGRGARFYADSTCETCRLAFLEVFATFGPTVVPSHVHSEDEIIRVTSGELGVGKLTVRAGMSIAIPKDYRYSLRAPGPFTFVNYRRDASTVLNTPGTPVRLETVEALRASASYEEG